MYVTYIITWIVYAGQYWDEIPPQYYLLPLQINLQHVCFFHVHLGHVTLSFLSLDLTDPEYSHCIFRDTIVSPSDKSNLIWIFYITNCSNSSRHLYFLMLKSYFENGFAFILILIHRTKQLIQCSGHASRIIGLPNHGIRFSTPSCTISKDGSIETLKIPNNVQI